MGKLFFLRLGSVSTNFALEFKKIFSHCAVNFVGSPAALESRQIFLVLYILFYIYRIE